MNLQDKKAFLEQFGNRVKQTRIEKGMTLEELANRIGYTTENARSSVQKIEAGKSDPPASKIRTLAKVLEVSVGYLMGWEESDKNADLEAIYSGEELAAYFEKKYGKDNLQLFSKFLELNETERTRIENLLSQFSKLDELDRMGALGYIEGIFEKLLADPKYSIQKESSVG